MSQLRQTYLQNDYVLADSGEYVFDIGSRDTLTRLEIEFKATNGGTNNKSATIADVLTSVEMLDGSEVVISASGAELAGICAYRTGRFPNGLVSEAPSAVQAMRIPIDFGRWFGDEDIALDLSQFKNPQIRIRWNLATVRAVGATGFLSGSARLTAIAHIMEGGRNPSGYLSIKRHDLFTTSASGVQPAYMPTDKIIRSITVRSFKAGTGQLSGISHLKLTGDSDKFVPVDLDVDDLLDSLVDVFTPFEYKHVFHTQNNQTIYELLKYKETVAIEIDATSLFHAYTNTEIGEGLFLLNNAAGVIAADTKFNAHVAGYMPFSCAYIGFGTYDNPDSWFNAQAFKQLRLDLTQTVAGASASVMLEEFKQY